MNNIEIRNTNTKAEVEFTFIPRSSFKHPPTIDFNMSSCMTSPSSFFDKKPKKILKSTISVNLSYKKNHATKNLNNKEFNEISMRLEHIISLWKHKIGHDFIHVEANQIDTLAVFTADVMSVTPCVFDTEKKTINIRNITKKGFYPGDDIPLNKEFAEIIVPLNHDINTPCKIEFVSKIVRVSVFEDVKTNDGFEPKLLNQSIELIDTLITKVLYD